MLDKNLNLNSQKAKLMSEFCSFCAENLPIENPFEVYVVSERKPYNISTTAVYEVGNNKCIIYGKTRFNRNGWRGYRNPS